MSGFSLKGFGEKIFGGTDNSAQKAQIQANQRSQEYIERMAALGRGDANALYSQGDYARNTGIDAAMGLMGRSMPTQMGMFQDGNVSAQMQLLAGMPQYQNAILGMPVDNSAFQPTRLAMPDASAYQQRLPDFGNMTPPPPGQPWGTPPAPQGAPQAMPQGMQQPQNDYGMINQNALAMLLGGRI